MVRALSSGNLSSCREGAQRSGAQIHLLVEDEGPKGPCPRSSVASVTHMVSHLHWSLRGAGYKMALSPESRGQCPLWRLTLLSDPKILGVLGLLWLGESSGMESPLGTMGLSTEFAAKVVRGWRQPERTPVTGWEGFLCPCSCWHRPLLVALG